MTIPTTVVELELNGSWEDVSAWLDFGSAGQPLTITRGRANEQGAVSPGSCTFSLQNDDGRFTLGLSGGAYYPYFVPWVPVRVTVNSRREFTGYMSQAETSWDDVTGTTAHTVVSCTDILGMMQMSPNVDPWADALIGALSPSYWWKLNEADGSLAAADSVGGLTLTATSLAGTDEAEQHLTFGVEGPASLEADTQLSWNNTPTKAWGLVSSGTITIGTSFTVVCVFTPPAKDTFYTSQSAILKLTQGTTSIFLYRGATVANRLGISQTVSGVGDGSNLSAAGCASGTPEVVALTVTPTTLGLIGGGTAARGTSTNMNGSTVTVGYSNSAASVDSGTVSHVAIINRVITTTEYNDLVARLLAGGTGPVTDWLERAATSAGISTAASATTDRTMERPTLKGSNPFDVGNNLAASCGAMFVADRDGNPKWYDPAYCPARVEIDTAHISDDTSWAVDLSLYYTDVQVDDVTVATRAGFPRQALSIPGLLTATEQSTYTTYLNNAADVFGGPRLSTVQIDLLTVGSTPTATYQALDLRDRVNLTSLPTQIPAGQVQTVEGYTMTVGTGVWTKTLNTAPDPRFVVGDTIAGVVGSNYRLGAF